VLQKLLDGCAHIPNNLAEKKWRDVSTTVNRHRRASTIGVTELLVGAPLPDLFKAESMEYRDHLARVEDRKLGHRLRRHGLGANELRVEPGLAVL
jgi:hypothetical protein